MPALPSTSPTGSTCDAVFQSTLWSQVRAAGKADSPQARQALETLCGVYWPPIYGFLRRSGYEYQHAKDLTQGFFLHLLEENLLQKAKPEKGRFRSFLLGCVKFFVSNEAAKERALKRGGGARFVSIDEGTVEMELVSRFAPERWFDRKWALTVLGEAMKRLKSEYARAGLGPQLDLLQPYLTGEAEGHLSELALCLGKTAGATRLLLFRMRNRFRRCIRAVIADTVSDLEMVESELKELEEALRDE